MLYLISAVVTPARLERMEHTHPHLLFAILSVGVALGLLLAVTVSTAGLMLPISLLMGWL